MWGRSSVLRVVVLTSTYSSFLPAPTFPNLTSPRLRDSLGVKIDFNDEPEEKEKESGKKKKAPVAAPKSKVRITGRKENVEEAKRRILAQVERLADETSEILKIPRQYHSSIIGQSGKYVMRLEVRLSVLHLRWGWTLMFIFCDRKNIRSRSLSLGRFKRKVARPVKISKRTRFSSRAVKRALQVLRLRFWMYVCKPNPLPFLLS